ncbi:MAG: hypothetical protein ACYC8V_06760 [Caulobacteraceae bacterium]
MRLSVGDLFAWITGFAAVFALYAHTAFGVPSSSVTPIMAAVIAAGLVGLALAGLATGAIAGCSTPARRASAWFLYLGLLGFIVSAIVGWSRRSAGLSDIGLFGVEVGTPILLVFSDRRSELLRAIGVCCIGFALADAVANFATFAGLGEFVGHVGVAGVGYGLHYLGLAGNSDAAGMVAFIGASYLAVGLRRAPHIWRLARLGLMAALFGSLLLIGSRRYEVLAIVAVLIISARPLWRLPPMITVAALAAAFLTATFTAGYDDFDNRLRGLLMARGFEEAARHPLIGSGVFYRDATGIQATYDSLQGAGVTESGLLDLAISYGVLAAGLFLGASLIALAARRGAPGWPVVILTCTTAELAFGDPLTGFLGSVLSYAALLWCQRDEGREICADTGPKADFTAPRRVWPTPASARR